jgi:hypothetical protein
VPAVATPTRERNDRVGDAPTERPAGRLFEPHGTTLEDAILGLWEDLVAGRDAECPVCGGSISMIECADCGSELS